VPRQELPNPEKVHATHAFEAFRDFLWCNAHQNRPISTDKQAKQQQQKANIHKIKGNLIF
jgi:hypothetical protein